MFRYITTSIIFLLSTITIVLAQQTNSTLPTPEERELVLTEHLWLKSSNVAGLDRSTTFIGGTTLIGYDVTNREYHRAQEGNRLSSLHFSSYRYDRLGKYFVVQGSFKFDMETENERAWSDMLETYNYQPYMYGSMRKGRYDTQNFDLHAKLSTVELGHFTFGLGIDYVAIDMSRLIDPRPRIQLAKYGLNPSFTYRVAPKHTVGLSGGYHYRKEKFLSIKIVNTDAFHDYVFFSGMENAKIIEAGYNGFKREFISDIYSGNLQYAFSTNKLSFLLEGGYNFEKMDIVGDKNESPGNFKQESYNAALFANYTGSTLLHTFSLNATSRKGKSDEFLQELTSVKDPITLDIKKEWATIFTFQSRYQLEVQDASCSYKAYFKKRANDYNAHVGFSIGYSSFMNRHSLPDSEMNVSTRKIGVEGGYRLLAKNNHSLWLNAKASYLDPTTVEMQLANPDAPVAVNVLLPDKRFYESSYYSANADLVYNFPVKFGRTRIPSFAKVYGGYLKSKTAGDLSSIGISIGILTK